MRIGNKIHIVKIVCGLQLKYMRVTLSKFRKTNSKRVSNRGGRAPSALVLDQPLVNKVCYMKHIDKCPEACSLHSIQILVVVDDEWSGKSSMNFFIHVYVFKKKWQNLGFYLLLNFLRKLGEKGDREKENNQLHIHNSFRIYQFTYRKKMLNITIHNMHCKLLLIKHKIDVD